MLSFNFIRLLFCTSLLLVVVLVFLTPGQVESENPASLMPEFIGSETCRECHSNPELSEAGFNIWEEAQNEAHVHALSLPGVQFPEGTNDNPIMVPPDGSTWDDYAYVIGGFGWKATFVRKDGSQVTGAELAQYNLETGEWTAYHPGEDLSFDVECARCHTTGITPEGSWNGIEADSLGSWAEDGVQCEGCHGPGSLHATRAFTTPEGETDVLKDRCGDCHNNGGRKGPIPIIDGYVANHAQFQELEASRHGQVSFFTCTTCHEPHVPLKYKDLIGNTFNGKRLSPFRKECQECHPSREANHPAPIQCVDCHMAPASKSAISNEYANGGLKGDIASHIWRINTAAVPRDSMYTSDGAFLKADESGRPSITLDFACLGCHQDPSETLQWAAEYAQTIHAETGTSIDKEIVDVPMSSRIVSNYPNPFSASTTIQFEQAEAGNVEIDVFDSQGQRVIALASGRWEEGVHEVDWDGISSAGLPVSSGIYIARIVSNESISTHMLVVAR
ncbi:MAG: T9SS type A sorting domain-containing protein [Rhodothermaceae bacterium]|nr:T9SS type A sorting domain-containing protein [Rhodothermaceae bacterium]